MDIRVVELCGPFCLDPVDGERLGASAAAILERGDRLCLNFSGVAVLASAFLNPAVGSLYGKFPAVELDGRLHFTGLDESNAQLVRRVLDNAKAFFELPPPQRARVLAASNQLLEPD